MYEVRVIARCVAQQGKGDELKALLRGGTADACRGRLQVL